MEQDSAGQFGKPLPMIGMDCSGGHSDVEWVNVDDIPRFTAMLVEFLAGSPAAR